MIKRPDTSSPIHADLEKKSSFICAKVGVKHTVDILILTFICSYQKREMGSLDKASFIERTPVGERLFEMIRILQV